MILPGHLAAGYIATYGIISLAHPELTVAQRDILLVWGTLCGDLPDIDVFYSMLKKRSTKPTTLDGHRNYATHAPIVWLVLGLVLFVSLRAYPLLSYMGLMVWVGSWSHLIFDSIEHGVMWLWPFSTKRFALIQVDESKPRSPLWRDLFAGYFMIATCYVEIFVVIVALALLYLS